MSTTNPELGARMAQRLAQRIYEAYGVAPRLVSPEALRECELYVVDCEVAGDTPADECQVILNWLKFALRNRKEEHPAHTPEKLCIEIGTYASKAASWAKFKRERTNLLKPQPNPSLAPTPPEAKATMTEGQRFAADLRAVVENGLTPELRNRYQLNE